MGDVLNVTRVRAINCFIGQAADQSDSSLSRNINISMTTQISEESEENQSTTIQECYP